MCRQLHDCRTVWLTRVASLLTPHSHLPCRKYRNQTPHQQKHASCNHSHYPLNLCIMTLLTWLRRLKYPAISVIKPLLISANDNSNELSTAATTPEAIMLTLHRKVHSVFVSNKVIWDGIDRAFKNLYKRINTLSSITILHSLIRTPSTHRFCWSHSEANLNILLPGIFRIALLAESTLETSMHALFCMEENNCSMRNSNALFFI